MDDVDRWNDHPRQATQREAQDIPGLLLFSSPLERLWARALALIFPVRCVLCDRIDTALCSACQTHLNESFTPIKLRAMPPITGLMTTAWHTGDLRTVVKTFKFSSDKYTAAALAIYLSSRLARVISETGWSIDTVIPVPLHTNRQHERGYNQSELIALALAQRGAFEFTSNMLSRQRATRPQVGLSRAARSLNVENAFRADPTLAAGRAILLVDDVCTTGATLAACAKALIDSGAARVYGVTVTAARRLL